MTWIKLWAPHFQSRVRMRGRAYFKANRVHRQPAGPDEVARATVQGNRDYAVVITGHGPDAKATCTCPVFAGGRYCKHIWATLLDLYERPGTGAAAEPASTSAESEPDPETRDQSPIMNQFMPPPLKARKRTEARPTPRRAEPEWISRLSLLRLSGQRGSGGEPVASPLPAGAQLCFVLLPRLSKTHDSLVLSLQQRQPGRSGWTRPKPIRISPAGIPELPDPLDRELVAMILGGAWVNEEETGLVYQQHRGHSAFALLRGSWRGLLKRMAATGRLFVEHDENVDPMPLSWDGDEPWVLWMVGVIREDDLEVTVELRRREGQIPVQQPDLILGGSDGIVVSRGHVGPLDDRGALRWATHFREEPMSGTDPAPIRVPRADVSRFLDRLYTLPHLPEMDLPEGLGRPEQRLDPVPHLDLFSPNAVEVNTGRGQLTGRVWFEYGPARVNPGDSGRFIAVDQAQMAELEPAEAPADDDDDDDAMDPALNEAEGALVETPALEETAGAGEVGLIRRDRQRETDCLDLLLGLGVRPASAQDPGAVNVAAKLLPRIVAPLLREGWRVAADQIMIRGSGPPRLSITSGIDWFELRGSVTFQTEQGEQEVPLPEILAAAKSGRHMVQLGDGTHGMLPLEWLSEHGLLAGMGQWHDDHLRFRNTQAALLDAMLRQQPIVDIDARFQEARARLQQFQSVQSLEPAPTFVGSLRSYQREGLGWLDFLRWFGMGGILADDMGLGKTIQVLALLDRLRQEEIARNGDAQPHLPCLVISPRSVVFNWIDEATRFAPHLRLLTYTGGDREALRRQFERVDLVVTSYGLMRRDIRELREQKFRYVILDEAQAIKNPMSQSAKAARLLDAEHRLALTGTPVENHLGDLWSIFEFLNPGMLGSGTRFAELVKGAPSGGEDDEPAPLATTVRQGEEAARIARALRPFILRRTKRQVLDDLPEKTEQTIVCEMPRSQRKIYDQIRKHYRSTLLRQWAPGNGGMGGSAMMVLEALLRLRQACCHPGLIDPKMQSDPAVKLETLLDHLRELIDEGSKALVFSQFTSMLALVRKRLDEMGIVYEYLDGQTRKRKERVERFQNDPKCPVFLISLKAGGLGLNLTAAEYVFILDPWWNPAVEAQAIDRTYRIGQTRRVFAYRLICKDTVEQRIIDLQQRKKELADAIVDGQQNILRQLTRDDLEALLS